MDKQFGARVVRTTVHKKFRAVRLQLVVGYLDYYRHRYCTLTLSSDDDSLARPL